MTARKKGLHEVRTRVTCHLPANDVQEEKAFFRILKYLDAQHFEDVGVDGYTHSAFRPAVFAGYWWPDGAAEPVSDQIVLCTVDYQLPFGSPRLSEKIKELKQVIRRWYRHFGSPQDEVWVVAQQVVRQD